MPSETLPATSLPDSMLRPRLLESGQGNWVKHSVARVRAALVARQLQPLTRAEWAEVRASLAPIRPLPPLQKFHPATNFFRP